MGIQDILNNKLNLKSKIHIETEKEILIYENEKEFLIKNYNNNQKVKTFYYEGCKTEFFYKNDKKIKICSVQDVCSYISLFIKKNMEYKHIIPEKIKEKALSIFIQSSKTEFIDKWFDYPEYKEMLLMYYFTGNIRIKEIIPNEINAIFPYEKGIRLEWFDENLNSFYGNLTYKDAILIVNNILEKNKLKFKVV